jgi:diaminohydroxyphosphoribosylaminopyrimidine deaminase / 5-amino-6-(5-phosphoribosylamino)uracil reductase
MEITPQDEKFMRRALDLAREGVGLSSPNPAVGAVIADAKGQIIGSDFHTYDGLKHAEVLAIEHAGERARGATLYLNLEPCSHQGRTGPCADAIISAGIKRVFASMQDPNPEVSGRGFQRLREAGIEVHVGIGEEEAKHLNEAFAKYVRTKIPLVVLKAGMTLDGKIAPPPSDGALPAPGAGGSSGGWITSDEARAHVQQLRHESDAIMVGVGTVLADDPLLTDRSGLPRRRRLLRVILDSRLRLPLDSEIAESAGDHHDVVVFCSFPDDKRKTELEAMGIRVEQVPLAWPDGRPDMRRAIERLGEFGVTSVLIEGGAMVNWAALEGRLVDKIFLYYAPKILAGTGSVPFAGGRGFSNLQEAAYVKRFRLHRFGEDFAVEGYLRDPYGEE